MAAQSPSIRAQVVTRRTYNRPKDADGKSFETWEETIDRVIGHQRWLWERAADRQLLDHEIAELEELRQLMLDRKVLPSGRTLWLGGTKVSQTRESSMFNCSFSTTNTVFDVVDHLWLLLQGCLPPDTPVLTLSGPKPIKNISVGEKVWSFNKSNGELELKPVTHTHDVHVPKDENIRITGRFGSFVTSKKHPVLVRRDKTWQYVPAEAVKLGDIIKKAAFTSEEDVVFDKKAWFVGAFHGDGTSDITDTGGRRIRITKDSESLVAEFAKVLSELSGEATNPHEWKDKRYSIPMYKMEKRLPAGNQLVVEWNDLVGNLPSAKVYVVKPPEWIMGSYSPSTFFSYLAGLIDTDGTINDQKAFISTSSKPMVDALQALCPIYGVYPWIHVSNPEDYNSTGFKPTAPMYRVTFSTNEIRHCANLLKNKSKQEKLLTSINADKVRRKFVVVPVDLVDQELDYLEIKGAQRYNFKYQIEDAQSCYNGYYASRGKSYDHLLQYDQVVNIETGLDIDESFKDITVDDNHSYLCGDGSYYVLHNCGTGHMAIPGVLNGFAKPVESIEVIRSTMTMDEWKAGKRGRETNKEFFSTDNEGKLAWTLQVGDSAEAWAKSIGKILAMKRPVDRVILDFSQIRPAGIRLRGYGWISSGDEQISTAYKAICELMSKRADTLLTRIDILDIENWLGTMLSSRRSAEVALCPYGDPEWEEFALAKNNYYIDNPQRGQSNNSLVFYQRPSKAELYGIFSLMQMAGGSEPGFVNGEAAKKRAPWFVGVNPCVEILLGDNSFCNLTEVVLPKFNGDVEGLKRGIYLAGRANYRQTCVNLKDGILSDSWDELNRFLRLCGVGLTGIAQWEFVDSAEAYQQLKDRAEGGAYSMADELGLPRPKNVTCVKPSGSLSKIADCTEGVHKPLGKYILNTIGFSKHDPMVEKLKAANYRVFEHPYDSSSMLITFPVAYDGVQFEDVELEGRGVVPVNRESAITQLERYKLLMDNYVTQNCSNTISYSPDEVPAIVDWIYDNWDSYVGVSFLYRTDPTKTAEDLGYPYLPQSVCTKEEYEAYVSQLLPVTLDDATNTFEEIQSEECAGGVCPVR